MSIHVYFFSFDKLAISGFVYATVSLNWLTVIYKPFVTSRFVAGKVATNGDAVDNL